MIKSLPTEISKLELLKLLNISANPVMALPIEKGELTNLEILGIRNYNKPSNISLKEIERLIQILPDCDIMY